MAETEGACAWRRDAPALDRGGDPRSSVIPSDDFIAPEYYIALGLNKSNKYIKGFG